MLALSPLALSLLTLINPVSAKPCPSGYYTHSDKLGCFPCGPHAATCHSTTLAITCKTGYRVSKGFCVPKPKVVKPKPVKCKPGFYKHSKGKGCYPCGPHALTCHSTTLALTCESGYVEKGGFCVEQDTSCDPYWYWHSQSLGCFKCGDHAITCHSKGLALTCDAGYTVQNGYCLPPVAQVSTVIAAPSTVTVTAGFLASITSIVTSISTAAPVSVTETGTVTATEPGAEVTATITNTATATEYTTITSTTSTDTITSTSTPSTTVTSTTSTSTSTANPTATLAAKIATYAGCASLNAATGASESITNVAASTPYTASTAVAACLYALVGLSSHTKYNYCVTYYTSVRAAYVNPASTTKAQSITFVDDSLCSQTCPTMGQTSLVDKWGTEYCGGMTNGAYASVWNIDSGLV